MRLFRLQSIEFLSTVIIISVAMNLSGMDFFSFGFLKRPVDSRTPIAHWDTLA